MRVGPLAAVLLCVGCAAAPKGVPPPGGIVHTFTQGSGKAKSSDGANCYWFETPAGTVVVDVPQSEAEAKKLRASLVRPARIFVTAARVERYGGLEAMRAGDVSAQTTPLVAAKIKEKGNVTPPTAAVEERTHDMIGEVEIELLPLGPGADEGSLAIFLPKTGELITGDLVESGRHLDLSAGRLEAWQDRIAELKALNPKLVYPGHGQPGSAALLDDTLAYLKSIREIVSTKVQKGGAAALSPADMGSLRQQLGARFPKFARPDLLDGNITGYYSAALAALNAPPVPDGGAQGSVGEDGKTAPGDVFVPEDGAKPKHKKKRPR